MSEEQDLDQSSEQLVQEAKQALDEINTSLRLAKERVAKIEEDYNGFTQLKAKFEDGEGGLLANLNKASELKAQIDGLKVNSEESLKNIETNLASVSSKVKEIEDYFTGGFSELKAKIEDPENGLRAILEVSHALKEQVQQAKNVTEDLVRQTKSDRDKTGDLMIESNTAKSRIEEFKTASEEYKQNIYDILSISQDVSQASSFGDRKKEIQKSVDLWLGISLFGILLLTIILVVIYYTSHKGDGLNTLFWLRLTMTTPLIFGIGFSTTQYVKERYFLEKYSFKATIGFSLQSYTKLLADRFTEPDEKKEILGFVIRSIEKVYHDPQEADDNGEKKITLKLPTKLTLTVVGEVGMEPTVEQTNKR